jgi:hypothetical protein
VNFFVAAQGVLGSDDDARAPDYAAGGATGLCVNRDYVGGGACRSFRKRVGKID